MPKCDHEWVEMKDGSYDLFCVKCSKKAKRGMMEIPYPSPDINIKINTSAQIDIGTILDGFKRYRKKHIARP